MSSTFSGDTNRTEDRSVADAGPQMRADARRNREQILTAARDIFAEQGPDAPLDAVARRAGVGIGTLYRRFADRPGRILSEVLLKKSRIGAERGRHELFLYVDETTEGHVLRRSER